MYGHFTGQQSTGRQVKCGHLPLPLECDNLRVKCAHQQGSFHSISVTQPPWVFFWFFLVLVAVDTHQNSSTQLVLILNFLELGASPFLCWIAHQILMMQ